MAAIKPGDFKAILRRAEQLIAWDKVNAASQNQPELTTFDRKMLKRSVRITIPGLFTVRKQNAPTGQRSGRN